MDNKVALFDLENNMPTAQQIRDIVEHYPTLYVFNAQGQFNFPLADLTELASWISSGQLIVLDTPTAQKKECEYAVIVGQLMALLEPETHIEVISARDEIEILIQLMRGSGLQCHLIRVSTEHNPDKQRFPDIETIKNKPYLQLVKKYCDALAKMSGKPNTVEKLRNSIANILKIIPENAQRLIGTLINLKIVKREDEQVSYRKKVLKKWADLNLDLDDSSHDKVYEVDDLLTKIQQDSKQVLSEIEQNDSVENIQNHLFRNFSSIDPVQMEVIQKLDELKAEKPKDIYALRDLLERMFPQTDVRLLLKELIEKGYIYWNGHDVVYSHEMFLH
ncbi:hypothetical protein [Acinetobacter stercoris]|uniref:PIN-like domain-containing protein n=1 Tax=Acinetobacter stercoris TaxID=2126983 RepID=A0A2U3MW21_9GAMM|nr:hypothetical protein [Acinetobacter stercoris]SPL69575.1 hypothetical protein KPC_0753 [Acinetobacter stercoris]